MPREGCTFKSTPCLRGGTSVTLGIWVASGGRYIFQEGGMHTFFWRVSRAAGAAQTPQMTDLQPLTSSCFLAKRQPFVALLDSSLLRVGCSKTSGYHLGFASPATHSAPQPLSHPTNQPPSHPPTRQPARPPTHPPTPEGCPSGSFTRNH